MQTEIALDVSFFLGGFVTTDDQSQNSANITSSNSSFANISNVQTDYETNYEKYFRYARLLTTSNVAAEDLVQQAFLNIISALEKGNEILDETLSAYVMRTIRNISITIHKKESSQPVLRIVEAENDSPEVEFALNTDKKAVALALSDLSETQRAVIVMHYFDGLKVREIAHELNIGVSSAKTHLQRARSKISKAVNRDRTFRGKS